jgi:hypothetical protein
MELGFQIGGGIAGDFCVVQCCTDMETRNTFSGVISAKFYKLRILFLRTVPNEKNYLG